MFALTIAVLFIFTQLLLQVLKLQEPMISFILLGAYTARLEMFKFFFFLSFGMLLWSFFMYYDASGSSKRKSKKRRAVIIMVVSSVLVAGMSVTWLLSKTNIGWWFDR